MFDYEDDLESWSDLIVLDDFYPHPHDVCAEAFGQRYFQPNPNFPWFVSRQPSRFADFVQEKIGIAAGQPLDKMQDGTSRETIGRYSLTLAGASPLIAVHTDPYMLAVIIFLDEAPPPDSGTVFYRDEAGGLGRAAMGSRTKLDHSRPLSVDYDLDKYEIVRSCANIFNRAIIFNGRRYHSAQHYYGSDFEDGRLTQTYFFNISPDLQGIS